MNSAAATQAGQAIVDHLRCPEGLMDIRISGELPADSGFFHFGPDLICYGACTAFEPATSVELIHDDAGDYVRSGGGGVAMPFHTSEVISDFRREAYTRSNGSSPAAFFNGRLRGGYYALRPWLPVAIRKYAQRYWLRDWQRRRFPNWPVDTSVEELIERVVALALRAQNLDRLPFIWFWPDGAQACAVMTHDVETTTGRDFSHALMDLDDAFDVTASFQVVPEQRYGVSESYLDEIRDRGFEVNVQDLNHDGNLYRDRAEFLRRARAINAYGETFHARGFRAAVLYRNLDWLNALKFEYDMSVPNVGHLDPQRGGCCTVFPYFVGDMLEIPLTTIQDYSLFYILHDHSLELWRRQIGLIRKKHGLMTFLIHPDYVTERREQDTFRQLLSELADLREHAAVWIAPPGDVSAWWIKRSRMHLARTADGWRVEGEGAERARVGYASIDHGRLIYECSQHSGSARPLIGRCA